MKLITKDNSLDIKILCKQTDGMTPSDIALICFESIKNSVLSNRNSVEIDDLSSAIIEQKRRKDVKGRTNGVK